LPSEGKERPSARAAPLLRTFARVSACTPFRVRQMAREAACPPPGTDRPFLNASTTAILESGRNTSKKR
jgi:hypothetical protein